jgi:hypothetical protein
MILSQSLLRVTSFKAEKRSTNLSIKFSVLIAHCSELEPCLLIQIWRKFFQGDTVEPSRIPKRRDCTISNCDDGGGEEEGFVHFVKKL